MSASPPSQAIALREPGPDHPIAILQNPHRVIVRAGGEVVADSRSALTLTEAGHADVFYIPRADVAMPRLAPVARTSFCPYKGDCSYFGLAQPATDAEQVAWCYQSPGTKAAAPIAGHIAFYRDRVDSIEELRIVEVSTPGFETQKAVPGGTAFDERMVCLVKLVAGTRNDLYRTRIVDATHRPSP